jgi:putative membrane protein
VSGEPKSPPASRLAVEPTASNHFAWINTRLSLERTFMAWIRTAVSLIGFGFTIVQFFQRLRGMEASNGRTMRAETPRDLGLALIATGVAALIISSFQYRRALRYLGSGPFKAIAIEADHPVRTPVFIAAIVLMLIGIAAFISVFFRFM